MKLLLPHCLTAILIVAGTACDGSRDAAMNSANASLTQQDSPLLSASPGDLWTYQVALMIPAGVTSPGAAEVEESYQRTRRYIGKASPAKGLPEVDCFEVDVPGFPLEREFVEIHDDAILMRGSMKLGEETTQPMWLSQPVPFITAGLAVGDELPDVTTVGGGLSRKTRMEARENLTVPAGTFPCVRLLTTGMDGEVTLRETIWFSPGTGIIRQEKLRKRGDRVIFQENQQLTKVRMKRGSPRSPASL